MTDYGIFEADDNYDDIEGRFGEIEPDEIEEGDMDKKTKIIKSKLSDTHHAAYMVKLELDKLKVFDQRLTDDIIQNFKVELEGYPQIIYVNPGIMAVAMYLLHIHGIDGRVNRRIPRDYFEVEFYIKATNLLIPAKTTDPNKIVTQKIKTKISIFTYSSGIVIYRSTRFAT